MTEDLTIVLTGRVDSQATPSCLRSIKKHFPYAKVILSGWVNDRCFIQHLVQKFDIDDFILTEDPGSPIRNPRLGRLHNVNRIIISSRNGLNKVKTKYSLRCRSDLLFEHDRFLSLMKRYSHSQDISKKILVSNITTIDARIGYKILYHVNDWFHFGETNVVKSFFDIPLMPDNYCNWYESHAKPEDSHDQGNLSRYMAEDWLTYNYIKKFELVKHEHYWDYDHTELLRWEKIITRYFVVLPNNVLGIYNVKIGKIRDFHMWPYLTLTRYLVLSGFEIPLLQIYFDKIQRVGRLFVFKIWKIKEKIKKSLLKNV